MRRPVALLSLAMLAAGLTACGSEVFEIEVGSCMQSADLEGEEVTRIPTVDCAQEHDVEAYAAMQVQGDTYPGRDALLAQADDFCLAEFLTFVGVERYEDSSLFFSYLYPTEKSWNDAGDREILCLVISDEPVTGTLAGSGL